jgi:hypothetical protein
MDVHVAEEDGGTSTENEAFKESHGGFAAAMKAVEEADGGEVASDCSDMSDMSDCDVFESLNIVPVGGIGSSESESEEEEEEEGGGCKRLRDVYSCVYTSTVVDMCAFTQTVSLGSLV